MRKYRRIIYEDRCQIYALSRRGVSQESIAMTVSSKFLLFVGSIRNDVDYPRAQAVEQK